MRTGGPGAGPAHVDLAVEVEALPLFRGIAEANGLDGGLDEATLRVERWEWGAGERGGEAHAGQGRGVGPCGECTQAGGRRGPRAAGARTHRRA